MLHFLVSSCNVLYFDRHIEKRMLAFELRSSLLQLHQYDVSPIQSSYKTNTSVTQ